MTTTLAILDEPWVCSTIAAPILSHAPRGRVLDVGSDLALSWDSAHRLDLAPLLHYLQVHQPDLVFITHAGLVEADIGASLSACGIPVFGPSKSVARLETVPDVLWAICAERHIPTLETHASLAGQDVPAPAFYDAHFLVNATSILTLPTTSAFASQRFARTVSPHAADTPKINHLVRRDILRPLLAGLQDRALRYTGPLTLRLCLDGTAGPRLVRVAFRLDDAAMRMIFPMIKEDLAALLIALAQDQTLNRSVCTYSDALAVEVRTAWS